MSAVIAEAGPLPRPAARTFHTLDALRGVACLGVVLFHAAYFYGIPAPPEGQLAVDLFFVMSGFIIAYRYDKPLREGMGTLAFLKRRLVRLYPLFLLGCLLGAVPPLIAVATHSGGAFYRGTLESLPLAFLMLPSTLSLPNLTEAYPLNYVAWSLALEVGINILYAATFRFWTMPRLIGCAAVGFLALCVADYHYQTLNVGFAWSHYPGGFARILYDFTVGIVIFRLYERKPFRRTLPWWSLLPLMFVLFYYDPAGLRAWWELGIIVAVIPLVVVAAVATEPPPWTFPACALAGTYSYVVYSLHAPLIAVSLRVETRIHVDLGQASFGKGLAFTALVLGVSILADRAYDQPVRRWLTQRLAPARKESTLLLTPAVKS